MLSYNESLKILKETNALLEGHFILSSGLHSDQYVQCAKLLSQTKKAEIICASLCEKIMEKFNEINIILSPAIGGIVVGYEIGRQLGIETILAERSQNKLILRRGFKIPKNSNVLIVEDVITTGKSALECSELVKLLDSKKGKFYLAPAFANDNSLIRQKIISQKKLKMEIFKKTDLPDKLKKIEAIKPGSRNLIK